MSNALIKLQNAIRESDQYKGIPPNDAPIVVEHDNTLFELYAPEEDARITFGDLRELADVRYEVEANYPLIADHKTEHFTSREDAMTATRKHNADGANVQIRRQQFKWVSLDDGWYSASNHL